MVALNSGRRANICILSYLHIYCLWNALDLWCSACFGHGIEARLFHLFHSFVFNMKLFFFVLNYYCYHFLLLLLYLSLPPHSLYICNRVSLSLIYFKTIHIHLLWFNISIIALNVVRSPLQWKQIYFIYYKNETFFTFY